MEHSLYINDESTQLVNFSKGEFPRLTKLTTTLTRTFSYGLVGESFDNKTDSINTNNSPIPYSHQSDNNNYQETFNEYQLTNNKVWDMSFGISLTANYDLVEKWNLEYSRLSLNSNIYLTEKWSVGNTAYLDLTNMNIDHYEIEFKRSLHCWDFLFFMKLIGYNKGFGLKINISEPSLQSIRMTQSTVTGRRW